VIIGGRVTSRRKRNQKPVSATLGAVLSGPMRTNFGNNTSNWEKGITQTDRFETEGGLTIETDPQSGKPSINMSMYTTMIN
jgi:hypothetical protein